MAYLKNFKTKKTPQNIWIFREKEQNLGGGGTPSLSKNLLFSQNGNIYENIISKKLMSAVLSNIITEKCLFL